jgi:uncharacterized protein (DUF2252 family)
MRLLDVWYSRVDASAIVAMSRGRRHRAEEILARYRASLSDERRQLLGRFQAQDAARKVVGVGSVGTRCHVVLLGGGDRRDDPLLLQVKQATASVLEPVAAAAATAIPVAGWSTASGRSRRPATSSSAGPATTTSASSGT